MFNNSANFLTLSDYKLLTRGLDVGTILGTPKIIDSVIFNLPPGRKIPPGQYFVLAGKIHEDLTDSKRSIYIFADIGNVPNKVRYVPYWTDQLGFIELLSARDNETVDFVRFGNETTEPRTISWRTKVTDVPAFRTISGGAEYRNTVSFDPLDSYDRSIVRFFGPNGKISEWTHVEFPTPGGPNDVPAGVIDSDGDGIPDSAKDPNGRFAGLDLYKMGARHGQKDLFIQLDYMRRENNNMPADVMQPRAASLQKVIDAFNPKIHIHFDVGSLFSPSVGEANFNLAGYSHERDFSECTRIPASVTVPNNPSGCRSIYAYASKFVDVRRRPIFRYMLLAYKQPAEPPYYDDKATGISEINGNKSVLSLGFENNGISSEPDSKWGGFQGKKNAKTNWQSADIMHELGHQLGLLHGGSEGLAYKPNYFSVMNPMYLKSGLPSDPAGSGPTQRYYFYWNQWMSVPGKPNPGDYGFCQIPEGPCTNDFKVDYSNGMGEELDERGLCEIRNIGRNNVIVTEEARQNRIYCVARNRPDCAAQDQADQRHKKFGDWNLDGSCTSEKIPMKLIHDDPGHQHNSVLKDYDDWSKLNLSNRNN